MHASNKEVQHGIIDRKALILHTFTIYADAMLLSKFNVNWYEIDIITTISITCTLS